MLHVQVYVLNIFLEMKRMYLLTLYTIGINRGGGCGSSFIHNIFDPVI